jgi:hypothetical protein
MNILCDRVISVTPRILHMGGSARSRDDYVLALSDISIYDIKQGEDHWPHELQSPL